MSFLNKFKHQYKIVANITVKQIKFVPNKKLDADRVNDLYKTGGKLAGDKADFYFDSCHQNGNTLVFTNVTTSPSKYIVDRDDLENEFIENLVGAIDSVHEEFAERGN